MSDDKMRADFEKWYCDDAAKQGYPCEDGIAHLREGDAYGDHRVALNSKWEGWQAATQAQARPSASWRDAIDQVRASALDPAVLPERVGPLNYAVLHEFASVNAVSYNELCSAVRAAMAATPPASWEGQPE